MGTQTLSLGNYLLSIREVLWMSRFGGIQRLVRYYQDARCLIFAVRPQQRAKFNAAEIRGELRPHLDEYFLHQCPVLVLYEYTGSADEISPEELGAELQIDEIGTDNAWRAF